MSGSPLRRLRPIHMEKTFVKGSKFKIDNIIPKDTFPNKYQFTNQLIKL